MLVSVLQGLGLGNEGRFCAEVEQSASDWKVADSVPTLPAFFELS